MKIKQLCIVGLTTLILTGCGGGTPQYEGVINEFFEDTSNAEFNQLEKLFDKDSYDATGLSTASEIFESLLDEESYGNKFVSAAQDFINTTFKNYITSYKIKDATTEDDKASVKVSVEYLDYNSVDLNNDEIQGIVTKYVEDNKNSLQEIYNIQGREFMIKKVYGECASKMFEIMTQEIKEAETKKVTVTFDLEKDKNGDYKIHKIS